MAPLQLFTHCYVLSMRQWEILTFLKNEDSFNMSMLTLHRHLELLELFRWKAQSDKRDITGAVESTPYAS